MDESIKKNQLHIPDISESYWLASTKQPEYEELDRDMSVDAAIVGGGLVGITLAYLLKKEGLKVAVLEANRILQGTTGHTTAKVTSQHDLIYDQLTTSIGEELTRQYADANQNAIELIDSIINENKIDCDFKRLPAFTYTMLDEYTEKIEKEVKAASDYGIKAAYTMDTGLPFKVKAAMRFENQAQFHPRKYLIALAEKIQGDGSAIYDRTRAIDIIEGDRNTVVTHQGAKVTADAVILASHYPFWDRHGLYFTRVYPERSYLMGVRIKEKFPDGMFITAEDPGRSLRSQPFKDGELLIVGGEHHKTGHGENTYTHYEKIKDFARSNYTVEEILYRWSAQDYTSMDNVPLVGRITANRPNIYVATGFMKWGMTNGTAAAKLIRDLILEGKSACEDVYSPQRSTVGASAKNFIVENADVAKNFITDKLVPIDDDIDIKPGEARVIEHEGSRSGAYRDEKGQLHIVDTKCTHIGCELHWNEAEMSWDCPCHGSRFSFDGKILDGPALRPLKPHHKE